MDSCLCDMSGSRKTKTSIGATLTTFHGHCPSVKEDLKIFNVKTLIRYYAIYKGQIIQYDKFLLAKKKIKLTMTTTAV